MKQIFFHCILLLFVESAKATTYHVGVRYSFKKIQLAINQSNHGDTIIVHEGVYNDGNLLINKSLHILGINRPIIDGQSKFEVVSIKSNSVVFDGFQVQHSGYATLEDPCGIKVYDSKYVVLSNNILEDNFFGIYLQYSNCCVVKNNKIKAYGQAEQQIGNGIHCWKSDSLQIIGNTIEGHRDGIYFEFVTNSIIWRNVSIGNIRYGLHFMFSNDDAYISNVFRKNGAGVAVMFTKNVKMFNNVFEQNWGDAAYGMLLKEINDSYIFGNIFVSNTAGIFMDGTNRVKVEKNVFKNNGWGMKIQASCTQSEVTLNNFQGNTFDIATNGSLVLNTFDRNYWDKYEGYDLDKNNIGDIPFHPLSIFSVIVESNPAAMLLFRSFLVTLLDQAEKVIPTLTPDQFVDNTPLIRALEL
ncbi:MAG TPA: nitrous oxide reductase family maturation protein NosD [Saprospiraceae bacterium]|nr:nitrous oxide reductase family maturation protein NosD [Saprospiraceae bacterium]